MTRLTRPSRPTRYVTSPRGSPLAPTGFPERAIRATTCTLWPGAKARPGIIASDAASDTTCGKRLSSRFTASGGPGCAGSRTKTNSGEAPTEVASDGASVTFTRTTAPAFAVGGCGGTPPPPPRAGVRRGRLGRDSRPARRRGAAELRVDGGDLLLDERPDVRRWIHPQELHEARPRKRQVSAPCRDRRAEQPRH